MSDRLVLAAAAGAVAAALLAVEVAPPLGVVLLGVAAVGLAAGRPLLVVAALLVLVSGRAHHALDELAAPPPEQVSGRAQLASDPESGRFGTRAVVRLGGRRYLAEFPREATAMLADSLTGEHLQLRGRTAPLRSAPPGWVRAEHLAGRLSVESVAPVGTAAPWFRVANGLHRTLGAGARSFSEDRRPLYLGLVVGDDRDGSELTEHRFRASGLAHLLAVSGQNVAFVLAVAAPVLVRLGRWPRTVAAVAVLVVFVLVTRADPSVLRAGVMAAIAVLAAATGRVAPGTRILGLTVVALMAVDPLLVHSIGFRLSVCATAGLLVLTRPIAQRLPGPAWLTVPAGVTLAAQVATAPVLLAFTGVVPTVATIANLLAGPAAGLVMMLGVSVGLLAGLVREPVAEVLQLPARALVGWIDIVATAASRSGAPVLTPAQTVGAVVLVSAALVVSSPSRSVRRTEHGEPHRRERQRPPRRSAPTVLGVLGCVAATVALCWPRPLAHGDYEVGRGSRLAIGPCGAALQLLDDRSGALLDDLARLGVRSVGTIIAGGSSGGVLEELSSQLVVSSVIDADVDADGEPGAGPTLLADLVGRSGVPCSLPP